MLKNFNNLIIFDRKTTTKPVINERDLSRAKTKVPRHDYIGMDFRDMSQVLNYWINSSYSAIPCELWKGWDIVFLFFNY